MKTTLTLDTANSSEPDLPGVEEVHCGVDFTKVGSVVWVILPAPRERHTGLCVIYGIVQGGS